MDQEKIQQAKESMVGTGKLILPGIAGNLASKVATNLNPIGNKAATAGAATVLGIALGVVGYQKGNPYLLGAGIGLASDGLPTAAVSLLQDANGNWKDPDLGAKINKFLPTPVPTGLQGVTLKGLGRSSTSYYGGPAPSYYIPESLTPAANLGNTDDDLVLVEENPSARIH